MDYSSYFKNKNIVITGHTGFKGSWLSQWLYMLGAKISAFSLDIPSTPAHYNELKIKYIADERINLIDSNKVFKFIADAKPDYLFHLAAQPLVLESYRNQYNTYMSNTMGTLNILEGLKRYNNKCAAVIITSDKCYENLDNIIDYTEDDRLGGIDPYSTSKASAELIFNGYKNSFFMCDNSNINACTTRAGNVIGGGDWAFNRIVPDCFRSWSKQEEVIIRNPEATRPWQHVLDPLNGYLKLACNLADNRKLNGEAFNFGPESSYTVSTLVENLSNHFDGSRWNIDKDSNLPHESKLLSLNCEKSRKILNIKQKIGLDMMSEWTSSWYKNFYNNVKISSTTVNQIEEFMNLD